MNYLLDLSRFNLMEEAKDKQKRGTSSLKYAISLLSLSSFFLLFPLFFLLLPAREMPEKAYSLGSPEIPYHPSGAVIYNFIIWWHSQV